VQEKSLCSRAIGPDANCPEGGNGDPKDVSPRVQTFTTEPTNFGLSDYAANEVGPMTVPMLLKVVLSGKAEPAKPITHRLEVKDILKAYVTFGNAAKEHALKVVLTNK
jgi:threonine dehydrogenase-like Zn-dependent dehydrogenase